MKTPPVITVILCAFLAVPGAIHAHCADDEYNPNCPRGRSTINALSQASEVVSSGRADGVIKVYDLKMPVGPKSGGPFLPELNHPPGKSADVPAAGSGLQPATGQKSAPVPLTPANFRRVAPHIKTQADFERVQRRIADGMEIMLDAHATNRIADRKAGAAAHIIKEINLIRVNPVLDELNHYNDIMREADRTLKTSGVSAKGWLIKMEMARGLTQQIVDTRAGRKP